MELLDRYLEAVRSKLPWERQNDIIAELRANLEEQLEDRQQELGRAFTTEEAKAWVGHLPAPAVMAGRYRRQQYLIGPGLFPIYWMVLRTAMLWVFAVMVVVNTIRAFIHPIDAGTVAAAIATGIVNAAFVMFVNAGAITLVFAAIEYSVLHYPSKFPQFAEKVCRWDLNDLPPIEPASRGKKRTILHAVADAAFHVIVLAWLLLLPKYPMLLLGPGAYVVNALPYTFAPVIVNFYWAVVALNLVQVVWKMVDLNTGAWAGDRTFEHFATKIMGLVPLAILLMAPGHLWILLKDPAAEFAKYGTQLDQINQAIYLGVRVVLAITVITYAVELGKWAFARYKQRVVSAH